MTLANDMILGDYARKKQEKKAIGSILHGGPIKLFLVPASAPQLV